jgi:hypothetical protein
MLGGSPCARPALRLVPVGYNHMIAETINPTHTRTGINIRPHESSENAGSGERTRAMGSLFL